MGFEPSAPSVGLKGYDYSGHSAFFVTMVTFHRVCIFGEIVNGEMRLNDLGLIAREEWLQSTILRPNVQLNPNEFVVMPNHIHGIIWIIEDDNSRGAASLRPYKQPDPNSHNVQPKSLGAIVRAYKSAVTYRINTLRKSRGAPIWQRNYYEHIIRNELELNGIAGYILVNPETWSHDPEYIQ